MMMYKIPIGSFVTFISAAASYTSIHTSKTLLLPIWHRQFVIGGDGATMWFMLEGDPIYERITVNKKYVMVVNYDPV